MAIKPSRSIAMADVCRVIMAKVSGKFSDKRGDVQGWVFLIHGFLVENEGKLLGKDACGTCIAYLSSHICMPIVKFRGEKDEYD